MESHGVPEGYISVAWPALLLNSEKTKVVNIKNKKIPRPAKHSLLFLPMFECSKFSQIISEGSLQNLVSVSFPSNTNGL